MADEVRVFRANESGNVETTQTPGMTREALASLPNVWVGRVRTAPETVSGWHHHGDYESFIYVVSGRVRLESGRDGQDVQDAEPGDVIHVPKGAIHRESNLSSEVQTLFLVRAGSGEPVFNVEGPGE
jgi:uncharacterized RmlC-like cupin family protein